MTAPLNLVGRRFGKLVAVRRAENSKEGQTRWECLCDCGTRCVRVGKDLNSGKRVSCGCARKWHTTHGLSTSPEYRVWQVMLRRCYEKQFVGYPNYGGRGITVCDRWRYGENGNSGVECFYGDMGPRPTPKHSIERKRNDEPYAPDNCCWATRKEQNRNKRNTLYVTIDGERLPLVDAVHRLPVSYQAVIDRLHRGWDMERAVSTPLLRKRR